MKDIFQNLRNILQPPRWDSWQTLMLMAVFSALLAGAATSWAQTLISSCGWIWLICSVWWLVYESKKSLTFGFWFVGPWIISALIGLFLFSNFPMIAPSGLLILWAPVAALIAIFPNFIKSNSLTKEPEWSIPAVNKRQGMVFLVLTHLLVACWVQFYFLLQHWLMTSPSLQADADFGRGNFVINVRPETVSRGREILRLTETSLKQELKDKSWPEVERWLLELNRNIGKLQEDVQSSLGQQVIQYREDQWWKIDGEVTGGEYDLELTAYLQRPYSRKDGHQVSMICQITPKRIALPPEKIALKPEDIDLKEVSKNLPRFKMIAKVECEAPSEPVDPTDPSVAPDAATDI